MNKKRVIAYKNIFYKDGISNKRIYVQGEPGCGKSMFAIKLVHDWVNVNQPSSNENPAFDDLLTIQQFKFLFFIRLREVKGQEYLIQMIKTQLIDKMFTEDDREGGYKHFLRIINSKKFLVVQDGLDEWEGRNEVEPSMAGFQYDKCTVLTTTRPWKLADERFNNIKIDTLIEVEGLGDT
ncbi:hypothetical protein DPMN_037871 [Dreissena polymorpha]|uniref:NACHT domain-containing protein n=1 Tax=Dreissena polymorpha TaxID=45954 RepID=A0A9D4RMP4_DREPO|nr:hypothetical protein DPMN_037871 [Dreissena polymorpha]